MSAGTSLPIVRARLAGLAATPRGRSLRQIASFAAIGVLSTAAYVVLYAVLRGSTSAAVANAAALLATAIANTAANRRLTFDVHGRDGLARDHAAGLLAFAVALAITSASLAVLHVLAPHASRVVEVVVLLAANVAATLSRFVLLRSALGVRGALTPSPALERTPR